ncbi:alkaline phosphatase [Seongchinamella sediminis]|uniref:Alkaline phosphatase n=1 Tax=Seongchinamella sediminis TaxID=2283635 RepID=A0A3L7E394_9GAMM|nr:alkaline phosphatase D family protein [Seongchinamella sediminis]RLQ23609.1 alkaline phosphatase [Seongchinamella sediminis]
MPYRISRRKALAGLSATAALPLVGCAGFARQAGDATAFAHGVASGDPDAHSVVLWTRITTERRTASGKWIVTEDPEHRRVVKRGVFATDRSRDMTVKLVIDGLEPGRTYYYSFKYKGKNSPIGRTRTLPAGPLDKIGIALASCSNYPFGYFNAYETIALDPGVDLVLHLGDYIYEYGPDGYGGRAGAELGREHRPRRETISLKDYRRRHAQYKADPQSQMMHAAHPLIAIWDDHESTDNPWREGANNHQQDTEGDWQSRRERSLQAYYEWMPVREPVAGTGREQYWRHYKFGDLASLVTLETRHTARDEQLDYDRYRDLLQTREGIGEFQQQLNAPDRRLLAPEMEAFLGAALRDSVAAGQPWRIIGNQVPMARSYIPAISDEQLAQLALDESHPLYDEAQAFRALGPAQLPMFLDAWDGYPWARERFYELSREAGAQDLLVVTGDSHAFWQNQLFDASGRPMGLELGTTGITSPGAFASLGREGAAMMDGLVAAGSPEILWTEGLTRGYVRLTLTPTEASVDYVGVSTVKVRDYKPVNVHQARIRREGDLLRYV